MVKASALLSLAPLAILLAASLAAPTNAGGGDTSSGFCLASAAGAMGVGEASSDGGNGVLAEAWARLEGPGGNPVDYDKETGTYYARAQAEVVGVAEYSQSTWYSEAGETASPGPGCTWRGLGGGVQGPAFFVDVVADMGCEWEAGAADYSYEGTLVYDSSAELVFLDLDLTTGAVNLTADPIYTATSPVETISSWSITSTDYTVEADGNGSAGCETMLQEPMAN